MANIREDWLKLTSESAIDPDLPICDPHHHLWYQSENNYSLADFRQDIGVGHRVKQTVFIESRKMLNKDASPELQPVGETEFIRDISAGNKPGAAQLNGLCAGIVGFADLTMGTRVAAVLEAHLAAGQGRFRGIRFTTTWDHSPEIKSSAQPGILTEAKFRAGFGCLRKYNLSFDAWLYHPQIAELVNLAHAFPDTPIILDHIGGPLGIGPYRNQRPAVLAAWKNAMADLASCQNVAVKLGGLGMELCGFGWAERSQPPDSQQLAEAFAPYFLWCIEKFGIQRCMFESNFPVDKRAYSYTILWNAFKRITQDFSATERSALFHNTATRVYRLPAD
jgi:L-fuconolactonase